MQPLPRVSWLRVKVKVHIIGLAKTHHLGKKSVAGRKVWCGGVTALLAQSALHGADHEHHCPSK